MVPAIDVDFEVFKALTNLRATEDVTYNDVVRGLLNLGPASRTKPPVAPGGAVFKDVLFPEGTQFRATYKGKTYTAEIREGRWIGDDGEPRNSPSEAAHSITDTARNGWTFWQAKRPGDAAWRMLADFR